MVQPSIFAASVPLSETWEELAFHEINIAYVTDDPVPSFVGGARRRILSLTSSSPRSFASDAVAGGPRSVRFNILESGSDQDFERLIAETEETGRMEIAGSIRIHISRVLQKTEPR